MSRLLSAVALVVLFAAGSAVARAADAPAASSATNIENPTTGFASDVARLLAAYPEGGVALEEALVALVKDQADQAMAVSELITQLGARPTPGQIAAVGNAIRLAAHFSPEKLQQAIAQLVALADDPVMMAMNIMAVSPYLEDDTQAVLGLALAKATMLLKQSGKVDIAGVIDAEIATAKDSPLHRAYVTERGGDALTTGSTNSVPKKNTIDPPRNFEPQTASPN